MPKVKKITLSYSVLNQYRTCPTAFKYRYAESLLRPYMNTIQKGSPLEFGKFTHAFLELYHGGVPGDQALTAVLADAAQTGLGAVEPSALRSLLHLELLLRAYIRQYPQPEAGLAVMRLDGKPALEYEVDTLLSTNPIVIWRQHLDGLIETAEGPMVFEHKTSSGNLTTDFVERMLPNDQAVGYVYGVRKSLGIDVSGVLFNGLCTYRPLVNDGYRPRGGTAPMPLFSRRVVPIDSWMLEEWETETLRSIKRLIEDLEEGAYSKDAPTTCTIYNARCPFADLCKCLPAERDSLKELAYDRESWKGFQVEYAE